MNYKGTPTETFWHDWRGRNSKRILKNRGWSVRPAGDGWEASISKEAFEKYHTTSSIEDWIDISKEPTHSAPESPSPKGKGSPYDCSDLPEHITRPGKTFTLLSTYKGRTETHYLDTELEVIDVYLPHAKEEVKQEKTELLKNLIDNSEAGRTPGAEFMLPPINRREWRLKFNG